MPTTRRTRAAAKAAEAEETADDIAAIAAGLFDAPEEGAAAEPAEPAAAEDGPAATTSAEVAAEEPSTAAQVRRGRIMLSASETQAATTPQARAKLRLDDLTAPWPHLVNAPPQVGQLLQYGGASLLTACRRLCRCRRRGWSTTPQT